MTTPDILDLTPTAKLYPPHRTGLMPLALCDIIDMGERVDTMNGETKIKHECKLAFVSGDLRDDGKPQVLYCKAFTLPGFHERSNLRKFLETWNGKKFSDAELPNRDTGNPGPDLRAYVGRIGTGNVIHVDRKGGGVLAQVTSVMPPMDGMVTSDAIKAALKGYTRGGWVAKAREQNAAGVAAWRAQNKTEGKNVMSAAPAAITAALDLETFSPSDDLPF